MGLWPYRLTASRIQVERQDLCEFDQMVQRLERSPDHEDSVQSHMLFWTRVRCFREI